MVTPYMSHVTLYMSHITLYMSHITLPFTVRATLREITYIRRFSKTGVSQTDVTHDTGNSQFYMTQW